MSESRVGRAGAEQPPVRPTGDPLDRVGSGFGGWLLTISGPTAPREMQGSADDEGAGAGGTRGAEGSVVLTVDGHGDGAVGRLDADGWGDREGLGGTEGEVAAEDHRTAAVPDDHPGAGGG